MTATIHKLPTQVVVLRAKRSACGTEATCDCNAPYVPARERAAVAIVANPSASNRAIAAQIGVSEPTVRRARDATASGDAVEKRVGLDGKARRMPRPTPNQNELSVCAGSKRIERAHVELGILYWAWFDLPLKQKPVPRDLVEELKGLREELNFLIEEFESAVVPS